MRAGLRRADGRGGPGEPAAVRTAVGRRRSSQALPFADGAFDAAWCLGVLCTTSDKAGALAELRRVLRPGGRLGLLVFVADGPLTPPLPEGNEFPSEDGAARPAARRRVRARGVRRTPTSRDSPPEWTERADAVDAEVERRHGEDPAFQQAQENARRVGRLLSAGELRAWLGRRVTGCAETPGG